MERGYTRPLICRFCRFPAVDGAVQMSELDQDNLSEWCSLNLDTIMDTKEQEGEPFLCQFCVWDARFVAENATDKIGKISGNWWNQPRQFNHNYKYYLDEKIQPCAVKILGLTAKKLAKYGIDSIEGGQNVTANEEEEKQVDGQKLSEDENSCDIVWISPCRSSVIQFSPNIQTDKLNVKHESSKIISKNPSEQGEQFNQGIKSEQLKTGICIKEESLVPLKVEEKDPPSKLLKTQISNPPIKIETVKIKSDSNKLLSRSKATDKIRILDKLKSFKFVKMHLDSFPQKASSIDIDKAAVNCTEQQQTYSENQVDLIKVHCMFCNKLLPKRYLQSHIKIYHKNEVTCFVKIS